MSSTTRARWTLIGENLTRCGVTGGYTILRADVTAAGQAGLPAAFDLVFLDPPYAMTPDEAVETVASVIAPGGRLVIEHAKRSVPAASIAGLALARTLTAGDSALSFYRHEDATERGGMSTNQQSERIAVCPGSFDPLTNGHVDLVARAARLFDRVVVAILVNEQKTPLLPTADRVALARDVFGAEPRVQVETFDGLLVDCAARVGATASCAGLRSARRLRLRVADDGDEPAAAAGPRDRVSAAGARGERDQLAPGEGNLAAGRRHQRPGPARGPGTVARRWAPSARATR